MVARKVVARMAGRGLLPAGKKKPGTCNYCHKPGHWANECRKRIADEKAAPTAASATAESTQSKAAPPPTPPTLSPAPSGKGAGKIGKAALLMSSVLPAAGFCPDTPDRSQFFTMTAMIFSIFMCFTLALLICRLVACLGSSRQSCFACACVAVAVALAACAPRPQSESRLPLVCPTLALPAVTCQDPTYILLDSGGSVHMLSEDTIGVTARIIREIPVEALEVSVANDQVMRIEKYALVELWFPCEESDGKGFKTYKEIKVQFEAYLSPSSISILSAGTLQRLGFQVWHYENVAQLQLSFPSAGLRFYTELYANTSWVTTCSYIGDVEETVCASVPSALVAVCS